MQIDADGNVVGALDHCSTEQRQYKHRPQLSAHTAHAAATRSSVEFALVLPESQKLLLDYGPAEGPRVFEHEVVLMVRVASRWQAVQRFATDFYSFQERGEIVGVISDKNIARAVCAIYGQAERLLVLLLRVTNCTLRQPECAEQLRLRMRILVKLKLKFVTACFGPASFAGAAEINPAAKRR